MCHAACGETIEGERGKLASPNYQFLYDNNMACDWTISVPHGRMNLSFYDMSIQWGGDDCRHDSVIVSTPRGQGQATGKTGTYKGVPLKYGFHDCLTGIACTICFIRLDFNFNVILYFDRLI